MLELELVVLSKLLRSAEIEWLTSLFKLNFFAECVAQTTLDQIDREISDVDPNPLPAELLRGVNGRAASAERVEDHIAGIGRALNDPLKQCLWFLRRIAESFLRLRVDWRNVSNNILHESANA